MSIDFLLTSLVVVLVPGTGVIYTLATGLERGEKASLAAALGCTLGIVPSLVAAITGVAAILHTSALAFSVLKILGVIYLLYMALCLVKQGGALELSGQSPCQLSLVRIGIIGAVINVLNPKLSVFFLAFLPQFITAGERVFEQMLGLGGIFMLMTLMVFSAYGLGAAWIRHHVEQRPGVMTAFRRLFAGTFVALSAKLALVER
ncbi:LysE family translocator [Halomonas litopenaei]|uniref:LysE family translocator n=1 Tax=Halomonas litopenaei TaxID=2109328 RepID=UPI001A8C1904|nr:LysE family translocator [Halomonas litopenaei]MBN8413285.1 LysE family translocator [Halomonas litopenaei]